MKANEIKNSTIFQQDGKTIFVKKVHVQSPSSRSGNTLSKVSGYDIISRQKFERSFKGDETVDSIDVSRRAVSLLYRDADGCTFMDTESYDQYTISDDAIEDELPFLTEGLEGIKALVSENILGMELPASVSLEIEDCAPGLKAASSSARTKPATLTSGLVVQVPEYLAPGEIIKVNTDTREFISRA